MIEFELDDEVTIIIIAIVKIIMIDVTEIMRNLYVFGFGERFNSSSFNGSIK